LSVAAHVAVIAVLMALPPALVEKPPEPPRPMRVTPLIDPPVALTQKAPNKGPVSKQFNAAELAPRPPIAAPTGAPSAAPHAPAPRSLPPPPVPKLVAAAPQAPLPEPPKVDATPKEERSTLPPAVAPPLPQPQIQPDETKPRTPFETPSTPAPANPTARSPFGNPVEEALHQVTTTPDGRLTVGDGGVYGLGGAGQSQTSPSLGQPGSAVQLLTDPQGVDFRQYLYRVLSEVRKHWQAILPESVLRMGRRGTVAIQFAIDRQGGVPKLVIVPGRSSGVDALDRAAVAGISAAGPFPPLPKDFKGNQIVLQFEFAYNMPKH
jgi:TonB family protein